LTVTIPASPGGQRFPAPVGLLSLTSALLLLVAGGLAIGGSFGTLDQEFERAGDETLTWTYTSWRLTQGGTVSNALYFHAPHFGVPLVVAGVLTIASGLLLVTGRGRLGQLAGPAALASAGLLAGTVWALGMVVSADLDAETSSANFELTWRSGIGFWLVLAAGVAGAAGGVTALLRGSRPVEPPTPRYGFPAPVPSVPFIPAPAQQVDPLSGSPLGPAMPVFQPPTPPPEEPGEPT
jgi:hypothetical protein